VDDATNTKTNPEPLPLTRLQVFLDGMVEQEFWADEWRFELQDEGRTLKAFGAGTGDAARAARARAFAAEVGTITQQILKESRERKQ
jgi:hypothetical protein